MPHVELTRRLLVDTPELTVAQVRCPGHGVRWSAPEPIDLAGVAVEAGFADQAHLTRTLRAELALSPARLRTLLSPAVTRLSEVEGTTSK